MKEIEFMIEKDLPHLTKMQIHTVYSIYVQENHARKVLKISF